MVKINQPKPVGYPFSIIEMKKRDSRTTTCEIPKAGQAVFVSDHDLNSC